MLDSTLRTTVHLSASNTAGSKESMRAFRLVLVADLVGTLKGLSNLLSFSGVDISA